jgi:hypothetical protein
MPRQVAKATIRRGALGMWIAATSIWLGLGFAISAWDWWHHGIGMSLLRDVLILFAVPTIALVFLWAFEKIVGWATVLPGRNG